MINSALIPFNKSLSVITLNIVHSKRNSFELILGFYDEYVETWDNF